ncbi:hypothetical protein [Bradyrhizobium cenepequi]|uniref:hypothetical protein n=1 Tax=Bradyrhizobium cenepequi TaxID=2821403 RepID=UPI001CE2421F|nr:hypothetical protein [Bradyrhizobium cenepequi]MCA6111757.1 hypothetical protein [Bradyrhizobium cenepequi]
MVDISARVTPRQAHGGDFDDPELAEYRYLQSHRADAGAETEEPAPLFLSYPLDEDGGAKFRRGSLEHSLGRSLLTSGLLIAAAAAVAVSLLSLDVTHDIIITAKTWLLGTSQVQARTVMAALPQSGSEPAPPAAKSGPPSREQIAAAYQEAIKGGQAVARLAAAPSTAPPAPTAAPPAPSAAPQASVSAPAAPPARRLNSDELGALMKRANGLLEIGDIAAARLLLERAADAQEADAALLLARTYDPLVLGTKDARAITPDPAQARIWYRRAAELGSQHAQQRLTQIQD